MSLAGAADTAALQHSRLPLAYPSRRLGSSQSLPVIRGLPSKLLAPPKGFIPGQTVPLASASPPALASSIRRTTVGRPLSTSLRHPLRDRVGHTSRLTEVLRNDCLAKLDVITERVGNERPFGWNLLLPYDDSSTATYEQLSLGGDPENEAGSTSRASSKEQPASPKDASVKTVAEVTLREVAPLQLSGTEQFSMIPVAPNPTSNIVSGKLSRDPSGVERGRSGITAMVEEPPSQHQRKAQKRGRSWTNLADTTSSSWRCSDTGVKPGLNRVPMMRATWAGRKTVDWDIGWLEPARPRSRSRSKSPDGERDQHMTLPPMLLSHAEASRVAEASRQSAVGPAGAAETREAATSQSEWRLRSLFENSMKHQLRMCR